MIIGPGRRGKAADMEDCVVSYARVTICIAVVPLAGCVSWLLPSNIGGPLLLADGGATQRATDRAELRLVAGETDVYWLEFARAREAGRVGGFASSPDSHNGALVVVLPGASTLQQGGKLSIGRQYHDDFGARLRDAGFMTWSVVLRECPTPYGGDDLADALEALDWIDREGRAWLGVERVYLFGYSTGATLANQINLQRDVRALVSLSGLSSPDQFETLGGLWGAIADLFPENLGFCQIRVTLETYGPPGSDAWSALEFVERLEEARNPTLMLHGTTDFVFLTENTRRAQARYDALRAAGVWLPRFEFVYLPGRGHVGVSEDPEVLERVVAWFRQFEP